MYRTDPYSGQHGTHPFDVFGAVEVRISAPMTKSDGSPITDYDIRVVADDMASRSLASQRQMTWTRTNDEFYIYFVSPRGQLANTEVRFSIIPMFGGIIDPNVQILSVDYYDADGFPVSGSPLEFSIEGGA